MNLATLEENCLAEELAREDSIRGWEGFWGGTIPKRKADWRGSLQERHSPEQDWALRRKEKCRDAFDALSWSMTEAVNFLATWATKEGNFGAESITQNILRSIVLQT